MFSSLFQKKEIVLYDRIANTLRNFCSKWTPTTAIELLASLKQVKKSFYWTILLAFKNKIILTNLSKSPL